MLEGAGRRDPSCGHAKELLIGFVREIADFREQRSEINQEIGAARKRARDAGFDPKRIEAVVRWREECEKHGREVVDEGEALFELYRSVVDGGGLDFDELMTDARDRALLKIFAPDDQLAPRAPSKKQRAAADALAAAQCSRRSREVGG